MNFYRGPGLLYLLATTSSSTRAACTCIWQIDIFILCPPPAAAAAAAAGPIWLAFDWPTEADFLHIRRSRLNPVILAKWRR